MIERITFTHAEDPSIKATFKAPKAKPFEEYWNALAAEGGEIPFLARFNLANACREEPDADEFRALVDEDWSQLPRDASDALFAMAGHFGLTAIGDGKRGEIVDMRALFGLLDHVPVDQQKAAAQRALFHREAMNKLGATDDVIRSWQCRNPHIARVCVALPWGGYLVARSPTISDRTHASNVQRAPSSEDESGAYAALCRFVYDCTLWCAPMSTAGMLEKYPGAGSRIGILIRDLGGGYSAQVGK